MSTILLGSIFENGAFGNLLNKVGTQLSQVNHAHDFPQLLSIDEDARANFSVIRRAKFFANLWALPLCSTSYRLLDRTNGQQLGKCHFPGSAL